MKLLRSAAAARPPSSSTLAGAAALLLLRHGQQDPFLAACNAQQVESPCALPNNPKYTGFTLQLGSGCRSYLYCLNGAVSSVNECPDQTLYDGGVGVGGICNWASVVDCKDEATADSVAVPPPATAATPPPAAPSGSIFSGGGLRPTATATATTGDGEGSSSGASTAVTYVPASGDNPYKAGGNALRLASDLRVEIEMGDNFDHDGGVVDCSLGDWGLCYTKTVVLEYGGGSNYFDE